MMEITPGKIRVKMTLVSVISDWFHPSDRMLIEWINSGPTEVMLSDKLPTFQSGERASFEVIGKPAFCEAVVRLFEDKGTVTDKRNSHPSMGFWTLPAQSYQRKLRSTRH